MKTIFNILFLIIFIASCKTINNETYSINKKAINKRNKENSFSVWYQNDTLSGICLEKYYNQNTRKLRFKNIIVAVIDSQIDINHEDLKNQIWINKNEIPNNNIDDDKNGYIDDINGWNFLGDKNNSYSVWANFEYVRLIRSWSTKFKNKTESQIEYNELDDFKEYKRALSYYDSYTSYYQNYLKSLKNLVEIYPIAKDTLKHFFPKENYNLHQLDSMYNKYNTNNKSFNQKRDDKDKDFGTLIQNMIGVFQLEIKSYDELKKSQDHMDSICNKILNLKFNEREFIGDNIDDLKSNYGNNKICIKTNLKKNMLIHSTKVSGIIAANRDNKIGIKGFSNNIKIMPLNISPYGNESDKDITLAIRYAVDNGAKVINLSFGKEFSMHKDWIIEALKYAEKKNVLVIHSAGNDSYNIDEYPHYPNDYIYDNKPEVCNNFNNVGTTTKKLDSTLVSSFSNYGKKNVDIFAPGEEIYTTIPDNKYDFDSGTSLAAPMVSGTAALIWLYYPKLTAAQVKQIILDSGTPYDIEVLIPGGQGKKAKFSELSKSGKVLNVYNAMKMAEAMSKNQK